MGTADLDQPARPRSSPTGVDVAFRGLAMLAALLSMVMVGITLVFLVLKSLPAFRHSGVLDFFTTTTWVPNLGHFGVLGILENTVIIAIVALFVGVPASLAMALFINEYVPGGIRTVVTSLIDLLAALPSLLFAIWGKLAFAGTEVELATWLNHHLSILPFFRLPAADTTLAASSFDAGLVVGIMIIPIVTSISRDVMAQVPREQCEGALALGGTRWGMIRNIILPFGRSGIIGGVILGFGRALGETIAVLFIISIVYPVNTHILSQGSGSDRAHRRRVVAVSADPWWSTGTGDGGSAYKIQTLPGPVKGILPSSSTIFSEKYPILRILNVVTTNADATCPLNKNKVCDLTADNPPKNQNGIRDINVKGANTGVGGAVREFVRFLCRDKDSQEPTDPYTGKNELTEINAAKAASGFEPVPVALRTKGSSCDVTANS